MLRPYKFGQNSMKRGRLSGRRSYSDIAIVKKFFGTQNAVSVILSRGFFK